MRTKELHAHLEELALIADLAQHEPEEALEQVQATRPQKGAREIRMAVLLFCQGLVTMRREVESGGGVWHNLSEGGAV